MNNTATMNKAFNNLKKLSKINFKADNIINSSLLTYHYENSGIDASHLETFQQISDELALVKRMKDIQDGAKSNYSEDRSVKHFQYRKTNEKNQYRSELQRCYDFCNDIRENKIVSTTNKVYKHIIHIGIGGSHLGPESAFLFFDCYFSKMGFKKAAQATFISNIDPIEFKIKMADKPADECLFIFSSKSGNTQETLSNYELLKVWWLKQGFSLSDLSKQCVVISCENSTIDKQGIAETRFYIDNHIGGRFSLSSPIGACVLSICFGPNYFEEFLEGAQSIDENSLNEKVTENITVLSALISVYYRNTLNYSSSAIVPYSYALSKFQFHLQQLICESNGKQVDIHGNKIDYHTSPIIFGSQGTNAQHSFFQLLNQGTDTIPVEFIKCQSTLEDSPESRHASLQLQANLSAQEIVFRDGNAEQHIPGSKSNTCVSLNALSPKSFGALLAYYENKVIFQGLIWNINSFDQPGVELAKTLAKQLLKEQN